MSHISLFILRKTNNPDDCADLVALKTQILIFFFFFFCLKPVPDDCLYNKREQVQGKWAKLVERVKSGAFKGCFCFFFPFNCCLCELVGNWPIRPTFPLHLSGCQSQQRLIKKKRSRFASWRGHTQVSLELWAGPWMWSQPAAPFTVTTNPTQKLLPLWESASHCCKLT